MCNIAKTSSLYSFAINSQPKRFNIEKEKVKHSNNSYKYYFIFTFLYRKIYILLENIFGKT